MAQRGKVLIPISEIVQHPQVLYASDIWHRPNSQSIM